MRFKCTIRSFAGAAALATAAAIVLAPAITAQVSGYGDKQMGPANVKSPILSKVGIAQHLNQQLPLNLTFTDDAGQQVELAATSVRSRRFSRWSTISAPCCAPKN